MERIQFMAIIGCARTAGLVSDFEHNFLLKTLFLFRERLGEWEDTLKSEG